MIKITRLVEVFHQHGVYNRKIAELVGVSESTVSRWVHNKQQPDVHKLYKIAEYLKIDIRDLFIQRAGPMENEATFFRWYRIKMEYVVERLHPTIRSFSCCPFL
ncbi:helix-turn-helix domain-containing protein [Sphingobacterium paludis]|uniref:Transcriptional regulator with XRE-family HTH domain n=1 Tax=Sphingobacterium paludis TaxID=1476465 RepID=A0A4R7CV58_9SPHI|nr:helix-turn-helix transcriptional regulator [Sphingobacterium paludis]TDS12343.1 transcriptional regulator with XRE-family HTH domain [Sphingobacterium paludis]